MANDKKGKDLLPEWEQFITNKDSKAFHDLYIGYYHYFHFLGKKKGFAPPIIEDAISDLFLYIWGNSEKLRVVRNHHNYLVTFFINKLLSKRGPGKEDVIDIMEISELLTVPSAEYEHITANVQESVAETIKSYVERLPPKQRLMIYQKFYLGLSYNEISTTNNVSVRTAYNTIFHAINTLKANLSKEKVLISGLLSLSIIFFLFFFKNLW
ncbi:RNA polymerase sigma factor (sigma-70 family) [Mucilaginibacter gracilis]|uniref:RNA polymerase sigma factor (Sigma-70 family) n=1 Tax=Mucilaginibacter gracilis TaxID=423350 RepID=A0A495J3Y3_9SPHI|nr:sigma-70 family RNA polymerase sigma factor [Mucilaginibacter gracilis]RKR83695.1 RNA polymerase sigma factor (sigma-70 family) [Mucilaginibacter gracilis]